MRLAEKIERLKKIDGALHLITYDTEQLEGLGLDELWMELLREAAEAAEELLEAHADDARRKVDAAPELQSALRGLDDWKEPSPGLTDDECREIEHLNPEWSGTGDC